MRFTPRITSSDIPSTSSSRSSVGRRKNVFVCDDEYQSLDDGRIGATPHIDHYQSSDLHRKASLAYYVDIPSTSSSRSSVGGRKNVFACDDEYQSLDDDRIGATPHIDHLQTSNFHGKASLTYFGDILSTSLNHSSVGRKKRLFDINDENQSLDYHRAGATARNDQNSSLDNQRIDTSSYHGRHGQFDTDLYEDRGETSDDEILPMVQHHSQKSYQPPKPRDKMYGTLGTNLSYVPKINPEDVPRSVSEKKRQQEYCNDRINSKPHR